MRDAHKLDETAAATAQHTGAEMSDGETGTETGLADLDKLSLADLDQLDESALAQALRRVLSDAEGPENPIAAFQAFL